MQGSRRKWESKSASDKSAVAASLNCGPRASTRLGCSASQSASFGRQPRAPAIRFRPSTFLRRGPFRGDFLESKLQFDLFFGHAEFSTRRVFFRQSSFQRYPSWVINDPLERLSAPESLEAVYVAAKQTPPPEVLKCSVGSFGIFTSRITFGTIGKMSPGASWVLVVISADTDEAKVLLDWENDDRPRPTS